MVQEELSKFIEKMEGIYKRAFRDKEVLTLKEGFLPDPAVINQAGAYLIAFKPPDELLSGIGLMSEYIIGDEEQFLALFYGPLNAHVTLSSYGNRDNFRDPDPSVLEKMAAGVRKAVSALSSALRCSVEFREVLFNQNTIILTGYPNAGWLLTVETVLAACRDEGLKLPPPWGAHMTISRIIRGKYPPPKDLRPILDQKAENCGVLQEVRMEAIHIGWCRSTEAEFEFNVFEKFPLF